MKNPSKLSDTDLCVMCGMCLPHCPTYQLYQNEAESPRGRIALIQSIDQKRLNASPAALSHIDHCLGCLNCESICPSQVPFGELIDEFRDQFNSSITKPIISRKILKYSTRANGLEKLLNISRAPIIRQLLQLTTRLFGISQHWLNEKSHYPEHFNPTTSASRGCVSLFTGCVGKHTDPRTLSDATFLLNQLGYDVEIPEQQYCCGAMHKHSGQLEAAHKLIEHNQALYSQQSPLAVLYFSPACGSSLHQIPDLPAHDIRDFIIHHLQQNPQEFTALHQAVALHESCSHRNMLKKSTLNRALLAHIPALEIFESNNPTLCCGAGGLQSINYPEQASALLQAKLQSFDFTQTNILISDNIGCSLHIKSAITAYNQKLQVIHPISLLARQIKINQNKTETQLNETPDTH